MIVAQYMSFSSGKEQFGTSCSVTDHNDDVTVGFIVGKSQVLVILASVNK